jgi:hypothetical protein
MIVVEGDEDVVVDEVLVERSPPVGPRREGSSRVVARGGMMVPVGPRSAENYLGRITAKRREGGPFDNFSERHIG